MIVVVIGISVYVSACQEGRCRCSYICRGLSLPLSSRHGWCSQTP